MIKYPLQADNVQKRYHNRIIVDVSLKVERNQVLGIVGKNGSGKTTTLNMLCGTTEPDSGAIYIENQANIHKNPKLKKLISYLTEEKPDLDNLTVKEFLTFIASVYEKTEDSVFKVLTKLNISDIIETPFSELSKGYKQKVLFASILIADTPIIVLDEMTDGLDPAQQKQIFDIINEIKEHKTIVMSSHNMQELIHVCDKIIVLEDGKITDEIKTESVVSFEKFAELLK